MGFNFWDRPSCLRLNNFRDAGLERIHGFTFGDSLEEDRKSKWLGFRSRLGKVLNEITLDSPCYPVKHLIPLLRFISRQTKRGYNVKGKITNWRDNAHKAH